MLFRSLRQLFQQSAESLADDEGVKARPEFLRGMTTALESKEKNPSGSLLSLFRLSDSAQNSYERGIVSGEIANLLQAEGKHSEAVDWYERAVGFFSECLKFGLVASAAKGAGVSQLALGNLEASEAMLRSVLHMIIPSDGRARVIHSLLNTLGAKVRALLERRQTAEAAATCTEMKRFLAEARQQPKLSKASKLFIKAQENNIRILNRMVGNPE